MRFTVFKNLNKILVRYNIFQNVLEQFEMSSLIKITVFASFTFFLCLTLSIVVFYGRIVWTEFTKIAFFLFFGFLGAALL